MKRIWLSAAMLIPALTHAMEGGKRTLPLGDRFKVISGTERLVSRAAQKMVAHASLAVMCLDSGLEQSAAAHLKNASSEAKTMLMNSSAPEADLREIPLAKITYEVGPRPKNYYAPVWVEDTVEEMVIDHSNGKGNKIEIKDSAVIHTALKLDLRKAVIIFDKAQEDIAKHDILAAQRDISSLMEAGLVSEERLDEPVLTVWSNLVLAENFMDAKEFKSARFTMNKAREALEKLEKDKVLKKDSKEAKVLHRELQSLAQGLDEKDPGLVVKARKKLREFLKKVKSWV